MGRENPPGSGKLFEVSCDLPQASELGSIPAIKDCLM